MDEGGNSALGDISGENVAQKDLVLANAIPTENDFVSYEDIGLQITDQKRRRIEPNVSGPIVNLQEKDTDMSEEDLNMGLSPKNLFMAGSASQTRPSL